ncbi:MAG: hypothetical protein ACTSPV_00530 [Candidatus Hodarchaeales archaeon]
MKILIVISLAFFLVWTWLCIAKMEDGMELKLKRKKERRKNETIKRRNKAL